MKLIFAQGNPGDTFDLTRHNVGFAVIEAFAREHHVLFQPKERFRALVAELVIDGEKILLAMPTTFYNETGPSARALVDFYKLDTVTDVLVIHDELALPFGTLRTRQKGSDAGNNGIKSLNAHLGQDFNRLRIGIGSDQRQVMGDMAFVLGRFTAEEQESLPSIVATSHDIIGAFIAGRFEITSHS